MTMKLPFTIDPDDFNFSPSEHISKRADLTENEKAHVAMLDIVDQRSRKLITVAIVNRWGLIVLAGTYLATNGKDALGIVARWAGISP